jgi:hypothetical protein
LSHTSIKLGHRQITATGRAPVVRAERKRPAKPERALMTTNTGHEPPLRADERRGHAPPRLLVACGVAALSVFLAFASHAFAHQHPKDNLDAHFLDTLERPDNAANPSRNMAGTFNSRLCCTDQDAVKVDYEMVVPEGGKYPEPEWYVWIDLDGTGIKRVRVPPEKIVDAYAPTGQAYAFVLGHTIQCFVRPQPRT